MARRRSWIAGALLLGLLAPSAVHAEWDPGDVAAAESYREAERERARRYRARVEREAPSPSRSGLPVPTARAGRAAPAGPTREPRGDGESGGLTRWLQSEWDATAAFWHDRLEEVRAWQAAWEVHGAPRLERWRAVLRPAPRAGAPPAENGLGERLLRAIREELAGSRAGGRRER
jgi:hypothetical protein